MKMKGKVAPGSAGTAAAEWFVTMHAEQVDRATEQAFLGWLRCNPENESHYESIEALQVLTGHLRNDADVAWAFRESEAIASTPSLPHASRGGVWPARCLAGLGVAALALFAVAVLLTQNRDTGTVVAPGSARSPMSDTPVTVIPEPDTESAVIAVPAPESQTGTNTDDPAPAADESAVTESDIDVALDVARARLAELRVLYTDAHPEVQATTRQIEELERQRRESAVNESGDDPVR